MSDFKRLSPTEAALRISEIQNPIVFIHQRPDGDAVGSGAALCEIFRQLGREAQILSADPIPERLKFILDFTGVGVAHDAKGKTPVSVDVASPSQLGSLWDTAQTPSLMIDHHKIGEPFADGYTVPEASSAAEALYDILVELIDMKMARLTPRLAYALFAAVSSDTGCFAYSNASPKAHRCAAALIDTGIDAADINHRLFSSKSKEQIRAEGFIASKISTDGEGRVAFASLSADELSSLGLKSEHFETAIEVIRSLKGAEIAVFLRETERGKYKASLRSTGIDVAAVAAKFGGGGHIRAAGCSLTAESIDEAMALILSELKKGL